MYLSQFKILNFRKIKHISIEFNPGLNIIVGENNIGKTAIVDALRVLLSGQSEFNFGYLKRIYLNPILTRI